MPSQGSSRGSGQERSSSRGPDQGEAFGAAGLTQQLEGIDFPISRQELLDQFGDEQFQWTKGGETLTLRNYLKNLPDEIRSITEITHAVSEQTHQRSGRY